ncbi:helicase HerA-like domain-containing protein [Hoeflea sp.]|uniref:helicase HerA-like domain-containing protein n=1 Tax=Hoeflea sp. TaxID=1940281 RepID=UPI003B02AB23
MAKAKRILGAASALATLAALGAYEAGFRTWPAGAETAPGHIQRHDKAFMDRCGKARITALIGDPVGSYQWTRCKATMDHYGTHDAFALRHNLVSGLAGLGLLGWIAFMARVLNEPRPVKVVRGRRHFTGKAAIRELRRLSQKECRRSGAGLMFPPGIALSRDRESRHFLIWGSTGAGKTTVMQHLMLEAIGRGDKVLILDVKGDLTARLPVLGGLIAPHDRRSLQWNIAADCRTPQEARELAARLIPESRSDRIWSDAAREILVACIVSLQTRLAEAWSWTDLRALAVADAQQLLEVAERYHPEAGQFLKDPDSKTTQSILSTFKAHMNIAGVLAQAWPESCRVRPFCVRAWLRHPACHPIVLQHDGRFPQLTKAWLSGIIGLLASHAGSPAMPENPERRTWLFLDEFPQLERLDHFSTLLDVGRSKGISVVLGAQDLSQIRKTYGPDQANAWIGMIGTHIVTRMNLGESAEMTSRLIGRQRVEVERRSETWSAGKRSVARVTVSEDRDVVTPSELSDRLGVVKGGIRALMVGPGEHVYDITAPFRTLPEQRPASVLADWTEAPARALAPLPEARPETESRPVLSPDAVRHIKGGSKQRFDA